MADQRITQATVLTDPTTSTQQAGVNSSGNLQVAVNEALPAGTNNIGDVDVASLPGSTVAGATAKTADFDTGAGTDTVIMVGVALPATGGAVAGGTTANPLGVQIGDGTRTATVRDTGSSDSLNVAIVDASGNQITSFSSTVTPTNPATDIPTTATIAAGASANMDSADLASKRLWLGVVSSSVPFKAVLSTLTNGVATAKATLFGGPGNPVEFKPPHPDFFVSGSSAGADGFRTAITNLDASDSADFYTTYFYADN